MKLDYSVRKWPSVHVWFLSIFLKWSLQIIFLSITHISSCPLKHQFRYPNASDQKFIQNPCVESFSYIYIAIQGKKTTPVSLSIYINLTALVFSNHNVTNLNDGNGVFEICILQCFSSFLLLLFFHFCNRSFSWWECDKDRWREESYNIGFDPLSS